MVETHDLLIHPSNLDQKIWRYIDFTKFVDLLNSESLFFSRADKFEDAFEGSVPKKSIAIRNETFLSLIKQKMVLAKYTPEYLSEETQKERENFALNCWHINDHESAAMWKIYPKSNEGIVIQSTFSKLKMALTKSEHRMYIGLVNYIDYENDVIEWDNTLSPFIHKRKSFAHENELRIMIWKSLLSQNSLGDFSNRGIKIKIDIRDIIENIYVAPNSPSWLKELTAETCTKFGFSFNIEDSKLNETPEF